MIAAALAMCVQCAVAVDYVPGYVHGRLYVQGEPEVIDQLAREAPVLVAREDEVGLELIETAPLAGHRALVIFTPRAALREGRVYRLLASGLEARVVWRDNHWTAPLPSIVSDVPGRRVVIVTGETPAETAPPVWQRLLTFLVAPFFAGYALTALALRRRRRRA